MLARYRFSSCHCTAALYLHLSLTFRPCISGGRTYVFLLCFFSSIFTIHRSIHSLFYAQLLGTFLFFPLFRVPQKSLSFAILSFLSLPVFFLWVHTFLCVCVYIHTHTHLCLYSYSLLIYPFKWKGGAEVKSWIKHNKNSESSISRALENAHQISFAIFAKSPSAPLFSTNLSFSSSISIQHIQKK